MMKVAKTARAATAALTTIAASHALFVPAAAAAANPLVGNKSVQVLNDEGLAAVKGSGYYADYYGYYGNLYAYYAYVYSYYGRYSYASGSSNSTNAYYSAMNYSYYAYLYNLYAYVYAYYDY